MLHFFGKGEMCSTTLIIHVVNLKGFTIDGSPFGYLAATVEFVFGYLAATVEFVFRYLAATVEFVFGYLAATV